MIKGDKDKVILFTHSPSTFFEIDLFFILKNLSKNSSNGDNMNIASEKR